MRSVSLLAVLVGVLSGERPQGPLGREAVVAPQAALAAPLQSDLDGAVAAFVRGWLEENLSDLAASMSADGIRLQTGGADHPVLPARQARAALHDLLGSRTTRHLEVTRVVDLGGAPPRGFAELRWEAVVDRTSEALVHTVFVSFERDGTAWRINEIRVL